MFRKYLPRTVPPAVNDTIHDGNIIVYIEYNIAAIMAAGMGGKSRRRSSNGTCDQVDRIML